MGRHRDFFNAETQKWGGTEVFSTQRHRDLEAQRFLNKEIQRENLCSMSIVINNGDFPANRKKN